METGVVEKAEKEKIVEAFLSGRCPVCALLQHDEFEYLCHWAGVSDEKYKVSKERMRLSEARGFCNYHFWKFERISSCYGSAQVCVGFIEKLGSILKNGTWKDKLLSLQEHCRSLSCPLCKDMKIKESAYIRNLITLFGSQENRTKYAKGLGLCIPHLIQTVARANDETLALFLLDSQKEQLERIKMNAVGLIRKRDCRWEQTDDEKDSGFKAIEKLVGWYGQKNE